MNKIIKSSSAYEMEEQLSGGWSTRNGGRSIQLTITKKTPITEFEFDNMLDAIADDIRRAYLAQRFRPPPKKLLE